MRRLAAIMILGLLAGCASPPEFAGPVPAGLLDAYAIAHGMARSYANSAQARLPVVAELARLDAKALQALENLSEAPPEPGLEAHAVVAVAALTNYAGRAAGAR